MTSLQLYMIVIKSFFFLDIFVCVCVCVHACACVCVCACVVQIENQCTCWYSSNIQTMTEGSVHTVYLVNNLVENVLLHNLNTGCAIQGNNLDLHVCMLNLYITLACSSRSLPTSFTFFIKIMQ
jgi:hypothetical protein